MNYRQGIAKTVAVVFGQGPENLKAGCVAISAPHSVVSMGVPFALSSAQVIVLSAGEYVLVGFIVGATASAVHMRLLDSLAGDSLDDLQPSPGDYALVIVAPVAVSLVVALASWVLRGS